MQYLFHWELPNKVKGMVAIPRSKEEVKPLSLPGQEGAHGVVQAAGGPMGRGGISTSLSAKLDVAKPVCLWLCDRLITDIHGGFELCRWECPVPMQMSLLVVQHRALND